MPEEKDLTQEISKPSDELKQTTDELIQGSLSHAKDESKPWYTRLAYYVGAVILIALYYLGDKYGMEVIEKIGQIIQSIAG